MKASQPTAHSGAGSLSSARPAAPERGRRLRPIAAAVRGALIATLPIWATALTDSAAWALGLGSLTTESQLGQPFSGWIALQTSPGETVEAGCLSTQGSARNQGSLPTLTRPRLEVEGEEGAYRLRISTRAPVLEPVVSVTVTSACPGTVLAQREYTLLLDPPEAVLRRGVPVRSATPPTERPVRSSPPPPPPRRQATPAPSLPAVSGYTSVKVARGDTLHRIAARLHPEMGRRDRWQLVNGIVAANPEVFPDRNGDRLPAGVTLRVPDLSGSAASEEATRTAERPSPEGTGAPEGSGLRILSADEEAALQASLPAKLAAVHPAPDRLADPSPGPDSARPGPEVDVPTTAPTSARPGADAPSAADSGRVAELAEQIEAAQAKLKDLYEQIARLDAQIAAGALRLAAAPTPAPAPAPAPASGTSEVTGLAPWYLPGALALLGLPLAYVLGRSARRPTASAAATEAPRFAPPAGEAPRPEPAAEERVSRPPARPVTLTDRAGPAGPVPVPSQPEAPAERPAGPPSPYFANAPETGTQRDDDTQELADLELYDRSPEVTSLAPERVSGETAPPEWGASAVHRLLLEAELHLLFDQRREARLVLEQAVEADRHDRPDLRPWTMLFDVLRLMNDQEAFEVFTRRFKGRYNVSPPAWVKPDPDSEPVGLAERFPRVLDRVVELWGTGECLKLLNGLLLDDRGGSRQGFDFLVGEEISFLRDILDRRGVDDQAPLAAHFDEMRWSSDTVAMAPGQRAEAVKRLTP